MKQENPLTETARHVTQNYEDQTKQTNCLCSHVSCVVHDDELRPVEARLSVARVGDLSVVLLVEEVQQVLVGEGGRNRRCLSPCQGLLVAVGSDGVATGLMSKMLSLVVVQALQLIQSPLHG